MTQHAPRRLKLVDLVILVAASAVGVFILKSAHEARVENSVGLFNPPWSLWIGWEVAPFMISTAAGLLVARLLRPRPPWRRLFRQPGAIACLAMLAHLAAGIVFSFGRSWVEVLKGRPGYPFTVDPFMDAGMSSGMEVALVWAVLALARAWRPEPSWIDRAGRCLGGLAIVLWIAVSLLL